MSKINLLKVYNLPFRTYIQKSILQEGSEEQYVFGKLILDKAMTESHPPFTMKFVNKRIPSPTADSTPLFQTTHIFIHQLRTEEHSRQLFSRRLAITKEVKNAPNHNEILQQVTNFLLATFFTVFFLDGPIFEENHYRQIFIVLSLSGFISF